MTQTADDLVRAEKDGHAVILSLNRPAKKNAMNDALLVLLIAAIHGADDAVRAIVIKGAGDCFTSGRDTKQFTQDAVLRDMSINRAVDIFLKTLSLLIESPKPTIASVHGIALGGGQAISLACDFTIAEEEAKFGNVEMAHGFPARNKTDAKPYRLQACMMELPIILRCL